MLAIGRPAPASHFGMSSHHLPGKDENPFGYTFTTENIDHAAAEENVTAAGPPLLNEFQNTQLQNFFDQGPFNTFSNNFNFTDADFHGSNDPSSTFGFDFLSEAPPTFHGAISDATHANTIFGGQLASDYAAPASNDVRGGASDEVIGAANALLSSAQPQHDPTYAEKAWGNFMGLPSPPASAAFTSGSEQRNMTASASAGNDSKPPVLNFFDPDGLAGVATSSSDPSHKRPSRPVPSFGSDTSFQGSGFMAPSKHDTVDVVWGRLLGDMGVLQPADSGPNTRPPTQPSSPTLQKRPSLSFATYDQTAPRVKQQPSSPKRGRLPLSLIPIEPTPAASDDEPASDGEVSPGGRAIKRRRTLNENGFPSRARFGDIAPPSASSQRSSSFSVTSRPKKHRDSTIETPAKKRSGTKQPRENLTEEQKRSNHILSEQKRRNLIKQGFEELNELVPGLRAGGFSKSSTLMESAKFLDTLILGNQILRQALGEV